MEKLFLNDGLVDSDKAFVAANDSGLLYGAGLFETMRASNGVVFCLEDHLDRLFSSVKNFSIFNTFTRSYISEAIQKTLVANNLSDARIRLTLTGGPMSLDIEKRKSTLLITATNFQPYPADYYNKGILVVLSPFKQNGFDPIYANKTLNYFSRIIALNEAHQKKAAEAVWFTVENYLAEGSVSNIFLVKNAKLLTPSLDTPVLAGIARKNVLAIAAGNSIEAEEKKLSIDDLLSADEVFLTNVVMQVMPVISIEQHTVGSGKVGLITKKLMDLFGKTVIEKCKK